MKSEERHRLQHNALADWIAEAIQTAKPHANAILVGVLLVIVGAAGYYAWTKMASASTLQAWDEFNAALGTDDVAKFDDVISGFPRTNASYAASLVAGDIHLTEGCERLFANKATGNTALSKAVDNYEAVLAGCRLPSLCEGATYGLARARESRGELDKATELYQAVQTKWPGGAYAVAAASRVEALKQPSTKAFYDRFAKFDPKPAFSSEPGAAGDKPVFDMKNVPSEGAPSSPASGNDIKFDGGKGAANAAKPADEKPADAQKTDEAAK